MPELGAPSNAFLSCKCPALNDSKSRTEKLTLAIIVFSFLIVNPRKLKRFYRQVIQIAFFFSKNLKFLKKKKTDKSSDANKSEIFVNETEQNSED